MWWACRPRAAPQPGTAQLGWRCSSARRSRRLTRRRSAGADEPAVTLQPDFAGGITAQVPAFGLGQQRTQMQRRGALGHVEVHHHRGVLPMGAAGCLGVPAGLDQAQKRLEGARHRRPLI